MGISLYLSRKLRILSFISIYLVLIIHTAMPNASDFIYFDFFQRFIGDFICRLYLPLFMSISGFLFFKNITNPSKLIWIKKYKSRFKSLLIPYIIWNILFIIQLAIFQYNPITAPWISTGITPFIESGSVIYSIWIIFIHPANLPLWFMRDLMLIMIFTPLLFYLIKSKIFYPLLIFLLIVGMKFQFAFSLSFFLIGASFSINKTNLDFKINNKLLLLVLLLLSVFLGVYLTVKGPITNLNFYFSIIPLLLLWFGYDYIVIKGTTFKFLDKMLPFTFFIYCFHEPSINIFKKTLVYLGNKSEFSYFFTYLISPILMVFLCYVIGNFLKNIMPKAFSVITGNRI